MNKDLSLCAELYREDATVDIVSQLVNSIHANEETVTTLVHELAQPLTIINTYLGGCVRSLESAGDIDKVSIINAMKICVENVEVAGKVLHRMRHVFQKSGKI